MKLFVISIRDSVAGLYGRPICVPQVAPALRGLSDELRAAGADNVMKAHPEDFEVFELGMFDEESGTFELLPMPRSLILLRNLVGSIDSPLAAVN